MLAIAAMLLQAAPASPPPAKPPGHWTVDYAQNACILTRDYGTPDKPVTIGFNLRPLGGGVQIVLLTPGMSGTYRMTKAKLILEPTGRSVDGDLELFGFIQRRQTLATLIANADVAADLRDSTHVTIERADKTRQRFALPGINKALIALGTCQADLLKGWGVDPEEDEHVKTSAVGDPGNWITVADYPAAAILAHVGGVSSILWTIGLDGRVSDCRVVKSSGAAVLDQAACNAITRRGRYTPAMGLDDKPMIVHRMRNVVWRLPE